MNHGNRQNHLGRTSSHREAMLSNMAASLIMHKRIRTTVAKAKELRKYVEPLITKAKEDTTHSRRTAFKFLRDKTPVKELFGEVAGKVGERPGGYTRILKIGNRLGDNAEMCIMELVDYNETYTTQKTKTRRAGRKKSGKATTTSAQEQKAQAPVAKAAEPKAEVAPEVKEEIAPENEMPQANDENMAEETGEPKAE